jgi:hypothetical protein
VISFLGSEVGRGHPFYLDGLLHALQSKREDAIACVTDVFRVSRGVSLLAWKSVLASYTIAGRGGPLAAVYHRVRGGTDYDRESLLLNVLGRDLRRWAGGRGILVVDHPAVVGALGGRDDVWYLHGEMVAPPEAIVRKAARVFLPTEDTAGWFMRGGIHPERLLVTGICVEPGLVPGAFGRMDERRARIVGRGPLTLGFFSSGAEPTLHVAALAAGAASVTAAGHRAIVFAKRRGRLAAALRSAGGDPEIVGFEGRAELDQVTAERFPELDAVVSPPHERSNWAVALGVPFLLVGPDLGPFAPRNRSLLLRSGVAAEIESVAAARQLAATVDGLRSSGRLLKMSELGAGLPFRGFERAADLLIEELERRA